MGTIQSGFTAENKTLFILSSLETKAAAPLSTDLHKFSPPLQPPQAKQRDRALWGFCLWLGWSPEGCTRAAEGVISVMSSAPPHLAGCVTFSLPFKVLVSFQSLIHVSLCC